MAIFLVLAIGLLAWATLGFHEGVTFGLLAYLVWSFREQRKRIRGLERSLTRLADHTDALQVAESAEKKAPSASPEPRREPEATTLHPKPPAAPPPPPKHVPAPALSFDQLDESPLEALFQRAVGYLNRFGIVVTTGVVVLFFGVAFLLKYAVELGLLPVELRLAAAAIAGITLVAIGWRTRSDRPIFARSLQGGGIGVLYLTVFAALRLYELIPTSFAFLLLVAFVALTATLALVQDSRSLAVLATAGGFLAPVLTSTGAGHHVALFSFYLVLNAGILAIAWFKAWRVINWLGFAFTFVVFGSWGARYYRPELFASTEPFLLAFFLVYVAITVLYALRHEKGFRHLVDGTLAFGVPLTTMVFQSELVRDYEYGLAWSAVAMGAFYLALAGALFRRLGERQRDLSEAFLATGVVLITLAVPFAFDPLVTSAFWALESAAIIWIGVRQNRIVPRVLGAALQLFAAFSFLADSGTPGERAIANGPFLGGVILALAAFTTAHHFYRARKRLVGVEPALAPLFLIWGLLWWLGNGFREISVFVSGGAPTITWLLIFFAISGALSHAVGHRLRWPQLDGISLGLLPALGAVVAVSSWNLAHPFAGRAIAGWLVALGAMFWIHYRRETTDHRVPPLWHGGSYWLLTLLIAWEGSWWVNEVVMGAVTWRDITWGLLPAATLFALLQWGHRLAWPIRSHLSLYRTLAAAPLAVYVWVWILEINIVSSGDPSPLSYVPILNPLDLSVGFALMVLLRWHASARGWLENKRIERRHYIAAVAGAAFLWLHGIVVRTVHLWTGVPFNATALFDSALVQTLVVVLWAASGLGLMVSGTRAGARELWMTGAVLMAAVVLKLFLVDLSHTGTVARIVSFIGAGVLMLVVGYLSPVPPGPKESEVRA